MQTAVQKVVESINDVLFKLKFNGKGVTNSLNKLIEAKKSPHKA